MAIAVATRIGVVVLGPSLALLFRLVLAGRFDSSRDEAPAVASGGASPKRAAVVPLAAVVATASLGAAVSVVAEGWLRIASVLVMLAAAVFAFVALNVPDEET